MHNDKELKKAIKKLPDRSPEADSWPGIAQRLDEQECLRMPLMKLPQHEPSETAWQHIEKALPGKRIPMYRYYTGIAAAILLLAGLSIVFNMEKTGAEKVTVNYSVEYTDVAKDWDLDFSSTQKAREYLRDLCQSFESNCESEEFTQLRSALTQTGDAIERTEGILATFPNDPDLNRKLLKFKKQEAKITRELLVITMK
ncbi:MAG: hypothetical protein WD077_15210 [Bacteroidia bacterium]